MNNLYKDVLELGLGEVNVGDIIAGSIYPAKLKVISKVKEADDSYTYSCKYLEGEDAGDTITVCSYYQYVKVEV